jgi:hypothetical protein
MNKFSNLAMLVPALTVGFAVIAAAGEPAKGPPTPEITQCVVYADSNQSKQRDCLSQARASCAAQSPTCELSIGLALTDNEQIDGDPKSWKKVVVHYRCNQSQRTNGPHIQDDHATMIISCLGRS